jgi:predicted RNase H-like HicB family nuclease
VKFGTMIMGASFREMPEVARIYEDNGLESLWVPEHPAVIARSFIRSNTGFDPDSLIRPDNPTRVTAYDVVMRLTAAIIQEGPWYVARCLEVEVASQGETLEEARANLTEALELYFEGDSEADVAGPAVIASIDVAV